MKQKFFHGIIYLCVSLFFIGCGEPVPVACTPDEEECATEQEGGFETGPVAGIAAGGAAAIALIGGGLSGGEDGGSSSSGSSGANNTNQNASALTGTLLDSAVGGVTYNTSSNLSGMTNADGHFQYRSGDQVTFSLGNTVLGKADGSNVITPVELAGTNNTADRRVINITRLLQSLDQDGDPANGISISPNTRTMLDPQTFDFDIPINEFQLRTNPFIENILKRPIVDADEAINHLHSSLATEGRPGSIGTQDGIRLLVPGFVAVTSNNVPENQPSTTAELSCNFAGGTVPHGGTVTAYQSASVTAGQFCSSQTRFCNSGQLSGSYAYTNCEVEEANDCQLNGNSIANGTSVTTYQSSTVPFDQNCLSEQRFCSNGALGGTYPFQACQVAEPSSCTFGGASVPHGSFATAYFTDSVPAGSSCSSQVRSCLNGVLSGSYLFDNCLVEQPKSCSFNGQEMNDGRVVVAYQSSSVPSGSSCKSEVRLCTNGILSGSYDQPNCSVEIISPCTFNGQTIISGSSVAAYQTSSVPFGSSCSSETRLCTNGTFSGSYEYSICGVESGGDSSNIDYSSYGELFSSWKTVPIDAYSFLDYRVRCRVYTGDSHYMEVQMRNNSSNLTINTCASVTSSSAYFGTSCGSYTIGPGQSKSYIGNLSESYIGFGETGLQQCKNYSARIKIWDPNEQYLNSLSTIFSTFDITSFSDPVDQLN